jgi:hypothetical protein
VSPDSSRQFRKDLSELGMPPTLLPSRLVSLPGFLRICLSELGIPATLLPSRLVSLLGLLRTCLPAKLSVSPSRTMLLRCRPAAG